MNDQLKHLFGQTTKTKETKTKVEPTEAIRIRDLPVYDYAEIDYTEQFKTPDGEWSIRPLQNAALTHCRDAQGGVLLLGCGIGKTLISFLLPQVMQSKRCLMLLPAALIEKTKAEIIAYQKHFKVELPALLSYERLSRASGQRAISELDPDLIICDEAHHLKSLDSTRTSRLGRYLVNKPQCRFVVMSGTLLNKTFADLAHLADWALEEGSPLPNNARDVETFDAVTTGEANSYQYSQFNPLMQWGDKPREAIYNRLRATKGVVLTTDDVVPASLRLCTKRLKVPQELQDAITNCFESGPMSDTLTKLGVDFDLEAISASQHLWDDTDQFALRALGQMLTGCLYYWEWPDNTPDDEWLLARKEWRRAVRMIREMDLDDFDSPYLIESGFYGLPQDIQDVFERAYHAWQEVKDRPEPPRRAVWVSDYIVNDIKGWTAKQTRPYVLWVDNVKLGERLSEELAIPYYGGGVEPDTSHAHNCLMSIKSHGTGKNLQLWDLNYVISPIADPNTWEQLLARTHRNGQLSDEVDVCVYNHSIFGSSLSNATRRAKVISDVTGQPQRIVYADRIRS
jgi:hypothetical protein